MAAESLALDVVHDPLSDLGASLDRYAGAVSGRFHGFGYGDRFGGSPFAERVSSRWGLPTAGLGLIDVFDSRDFGSLVHAWGSRDGYDEGFEFDSPFVIPVDPVEHVGGLPSQRLARRRPMPRTQRPMVRPQVARRAPRPRRALQARARLDAAPPPPAVATERWRPVDEHAEAFSPYPAALGRAGAVDSTLLRFPAARAEVSAGERHAVVEDRDHPADLGWLGTSALTPAAAGAEAMASAVEDRLDPPTPAPVLAWLSPADAPDSPGPGRAVPGRWLGPTNAPRMALVEQGRGPDGAAPSQEDFAPGALAAQAEQFAGVDAARPTPMRLADAETGTLVRPRGRAAEAPTPATARRGTTVIETTESPPPTHDPPAEAEAPAERPPGRAIEGPAPSGTPARAAAEAMLVQAGRRSRQPAFERPTTTLAPLGGRPPAARQPWQRRSLPRAGAAPFVPPSIARLAERLGTPARARAPGWADTPSAVFVRPRAPEESGDAPRPTPAPTAPAPDAVTPRIGRPADRPAAELQRAPIAAATPAAVPPVTEPAAFEAEPGRPPDLVLPNDPIERQVVLRERGLIELIAPTAAPNAAPQNGIERALARQNAATEPSLGGALGRAPMSVGERLAAVAATAEVRLGLTVASSPAASLDAPWFSAETGTLLVPAAARTAPTASAARRAPQSAGPGVAGARPGVAPGLSPVDPTIVVPLLERLYPQTDPASPASEANAPRARRAAATLAFPELGALVRPVADAPSTSTVAERVDGAAEDAAPIAQHPTAPGIAAGATASRALAFAEAHEPAPTLGERLADAPQIAFTQTREAAEPPLIQRLVDRIAPSEEVERPRTPAQAAEEAFSAGAPATPGALVVPVDTPRGATTPGRTPQRAIPTTPTELAPPPEPRRQRLAPLGDVARQAERFAARIDGAPADPTPGVRPVGAPMAAVARRPGRTPTPNTAPGLRLRRAWQGREETRTLVASPRATPTEATATSHVEPSGPDAGAPTTTATPRPAVAAWPRMVQQLVDVWQVAEALVGPTAAPTIAAAMRAHREPMDGALVRPAAAPSASGSRRDAPPARAAAAGSSFGRPGALGVATASLSAVLAARAMGAPLGFAETPTLGTLLTPAVEQVAARSPMGARRPAAPAAEASAGWPELVAGGAAARPAEGGLADGAAPMRFVSEATPSRLAVPMNVDRALVAYAAAAERESAALTSERQTLGGMGAVGNFVRGETRHGGAPRVDVPIRASQDTRGALFGDRGPAGIEAPTVRADRVLVEPAARAAEQALRSTPGQRPQRQAETGEEARHRLADQIDENLSPEEKETLAREIIDRLKRELEFDAARTGDDAWD